MTPLTPEGVSFSGHKSLTGKPCPENVAGADHVRVSRVAADYAAEVGLGEAVLPRAVPTARAGTGGVAGINCDAEYRVAVKPGSHEPNTDSGEWSVGEVLLAELAGEVVERVAAQRKLAEASAALKAAREAYKLAQTHVRVPGYDVEEAANVALSAGVDPAEVAKSRRAPRARRTTRAKP